MSAGREIDVNCFSSSRCQNWPICPDPITMNTCLVWGSSCRMSSMSRGKSLATATAVSFSPSGRSPRYR